MLTIIHTADLHNSLTPKRAARLAALRDSHPGAILLDSGDALRAGNIHFHPWGEPILAAMHDLGYAAMAMGNREFHIWPSWMALKLRDVRFPLVVANLHGPTGRQTFRESVVLEVPHSDGDTWHRVGVTAALNPMVRVGSPVAWLSRYEFEEPVEAVRRVSADLASAVDLVVALAHCKDGDSRSISALPDVDLTLAGHTHKAWWDASPEAAIIHSGSHARMASVIRFDLVSREISVEQCSLGHEE